MAALVSRIAGVQARIVVSAAPGVPPGGDADAGSQLVTAAPSDAAETPAAADYGDYGAPPDDEPGGGGM